MEEKKLPTQESGEQKINKTPIKQTKKQLFWEIFRFLLVGGTATIVDYLISYLFYTWLLPPERIGMVWALSVSTIFGFSVGLVVNWVLSVTFVFQAVRDKEESRSTKSFVTFALIGVIGLVISLLGMQLVNVLPSITIFSSTTFLKEEWTWWLMKCVMTGLVLVWNYLGRKIFIFKS